MAIIFTRQGGDPVFRTTRSLEAYKWAHQGYHVVWTISPGPELVTLERSGSLKGVRRG